MPDTTTHPTSPEGLVVKYLEADNFIDFGDDSPRPSVEQLDEDLTRQIRVLVHGGHHHPSQSPDCEKQTLDNEPLYVEFERNDPRNPVHYPNSLKWSIAMAGCAFTILVGSTGASYNMGFPSMTSDLNCTNFQATIGLSLYGLGFALFPLVTSSFSEEVGRRPLYIGSLVGHTLMHLLVALSQNIQTVLVARFLGGAFGSTGAVMVGGTIADIFMPHERSLPMSIYSLAALGGTGLGPVVAGWVEMNPRLQWRWIQWIHMILTGTVLIVVIFLMKETRSTIILTRLAKKIRKETRDPRYRARAEDEGRRLSTLIYVSCTRPLYLLFTEPIVFSISVWIGFAWGIMYCMIESIGPIFKELHGFNQSQIGMVFLGMVIGSFLGFLTNFYQERLYQKNFETRGPEARLYLPCVAGILFPISMFIYAWSSVPQIPWIALIIGVTVFTWSAFTIYLSVFTYLSDCYGIYASSASAGQSLFRSLMGMTFPLFTEQMFSALTYKWANMMFGCIAVLLLPLPFVLFFYGPRIRAHSKFARRISENEEK